MSSCRVDLVLVEQKNELFQLRSESYQRQYGESVDVSVLKWNSWDQRFLNLGVFDQDRLISCLRISHIKSKEEYKKMMLIEAGEQEVPLVILNRAATHKDHESQGLHSLLRWHALRLAHLSGLRWVMGTFTKDSKRILQLRKLGYEFSTNPVPWGDFLKSQEETWVAKLDLKSHFEQAEKSLRDKVKDLNAKYPAGYNQSELLLRMAES